jgi:hypothetical protein
MTMLRLLTYSAYDSKILPTISARQCFFQTSAWLPAVSPRRRALALDPLRYTMHPASVFPTPLSLASAPVAAECGNSLVPFFSPGEEANRWIGEGQPPPTRVV